MSSITINFGVLTVVVAGFAIYTPGKRLNAIKAAILIEHRCGHGVNLVRPGERS